jgi:hypothetical protein
MSLQPVVKVRAHVRGFERHPTALLGQFTVDPLANPLLPVFQQADPFGPHPNADRNEALVHGLYRSILGRDADAAGFQAWLNLLKNGTPLAQVAQGLWESDEHRGVQVDSYYQTILHRAPDALGRAAWVNALKSGLGEVAVVQGLLTSPEYTATHGSNEAFVTGVYQDLLGHSPDAAGQALTDQLNQNQATRAEVAARIQNNQESYLRAIDSLYMALYHRVADQQGEQNWLTWLSGTQGSLEGLALRFLSEREFQDLAAAAVP